MLECLKMLTAADEGSGGGKRNCRTSLGAIRMSVKISRKSDLESMRRFPRELLDPWSCCSTCRE